MATKKGKAVNRKELESMPVAKVIEEVSLPDKITQDIVPYAEEVLTGRALPDVRDGFKPVQRRILWTMQELGFKSTGSYQKSATMTGACIGRYHPHGDASVYQAACVLVRPYVQNVPLIDPHGNFGTSPGEGAANQRYTEMRLNTISESFMGDVKFDAVKMVPNFNEERIEPTVLPVSFPLLLVNGGSGIAMGFACNFAPHNPGEVIDATIAQIKNPKIALSKLMEIIPGPDFPTGGDIIGSDGIALAYERSQVDAWDEKYKQAKCRVRAKYRISELSRGRHQIEFYETPYNVAHEKIVEELRELALNKEIGGVTNIVNLADRHNPTSICVDVKSGVNADKVAQGILAKSSTLTATFAFNHVALVNGQPTVVSLKDMIQYWIDFRRECLTNKYTRQINDKKAKMNILEGLNICLLDIDAVIKIVRNAEGAEAAITGLMKKFKINREQADAVAAMRLRQLTKSDRIEIQNNIDQLKEEIAALQALLDDAKLLDKNIIDELKEVKRQIDKPRRSRILGITLEEEKESLAEIKDAVMNTENIAVEGNTNLYLDDSGKICQSAKKLKNVQQISEVDLKSTVMLIFEDGDSTRVAAHELPTKYASVGRKCVGIVVIPDDEKAQGEVRVAMATSDGKVKVLDCSTLTKNPECPVMNLAGKARVLAARPINNGEEFFVFVTKNAQLLRFPVSSVNAQGRTSAGVAGMKLASDDEVVFAGVVEENYQLVTNTGISIKLSNLSDFPAKGRGTQGMRCHKMLAGEKDLISAYVGERIGSNVDLPTIAKRDASGTKMEGLDKAKFNG